MPLPSALIPGILPFLESPAWSRGQLEDYQSRCLRRLVRHACERVPYYRDLFRRHGLDVQDVRSIRDLAHVPIAQRSEMQERPASDLVSAGCDPERLVAHRTSGSTGSPFTVRRTWFEEWLLRGLRLREQLLLGLRPTDVRAVVGLLDAKARTRPRLCQTSLGLLRREPVDCLLPARDLLRRLAEIRADVISSYPGTLAWVGPEATEEDLDRIRPRFIFTAAETLTPEMRRRITECFGAPVYDSYAAHEFNLIARECRETGLYHVCDASVIVEVLKDGEPAGTGGQGELVATALHSLSMPFVRYRLGDMVTRGPSPCPCGAPFSTLQSIQGRTIERFPLPDGTSIHPYHLVGPLAQDAPWVRRYQIIQERIDRIGIRVVPLPGRHPAPEELARLCDAIERPVGPGVTITLELADHLPPAESGKFRPYYSLVADYAALPGNG
jgi:phenylacetate-CoA ligase